MRESSRDITPKSIWIAWTRHAGLIEMRVNRSEYQRFQKAIEKLAWVLECHHIAGRNSFYLKAAAPNAAGLELLIGHLCQFGKTDTSIILSTVLERSDFQP